MRIILREAQAWSRKDSEGYSPSQVPGALSGSTTKMRVRGKTEGKVGGYVLTTT